MALSKKTKEILTVAMADKKAAAELSAAVDAGGNAQAAAIAALGATTNLSAAAPAAASISASAGTFAIPAEPTGAEVDAAIDEATAKVETALNAKADNADLETMRTEAEARLDAIEAKVDALIAALKTAGLMAS